MVAQVMVREVQGSSRSWTTRSDEKQRRLRSVSSWMKGPHLPRDKLVEFHDVDRNAICTHSVAGQSLSDKVFIDQMFARLQPVLPQGALLHNESATGQEKSDDSSR
jgi:hypothetical protein